MNAINAINNLSQSEFVKIFANIFEKTKWIAEELYNQKPFSGFEDLCTKMLNIFENAAKENQLKILRAHPNLADKIEISSISSDSHKEQTNAGLDQCSKQELKEFKDLNDKYKKRFGFPFILAIKGKNKSDILSEFKKRILNTSDKEFNEAVSQVIKIANLRLNELNMK